MKVLHKYLISNFLYFFILVSCVSYIICYMVEYIDIARDFRDVKVEPEDVYFRIYIPLLRAFFYMLEIHPIIVLITSLLLIYRIHATYELVHLRSIGISLGYIMRVLSVLIIFVSFVILISFDYLAVIGNYYQEKMRYKYIDDIYRVSGKNIDNKNDIWLSVNAHFPSEGHYIIYIGNVLDTKLTILENIQIFKYTKNYKELKFLISAESAKLNGKYLELNNGQKLNHNKVEQIFFDNYTIATDIALKPILSMKRGKFFNSFLSVSFLLPDLLTILGYSDNYVLYWNYKLGLVFRSVTMLIFSFTVLFFAKRRKNISVRIISLLILMGVTLNYSFSIIYALGNNSNYSSIMVVWLPIAVVTFLFLSLYSVLKIR